MAEPISPLTAKKVAGYLPLAGNAPEIPGRIIIVTHQIPYNIIRSQDSISKDLPLSPPYSPPKKQGYDEADKPASEDLPAESDPVAAAPVSKLPRNHNRKQTLRYHFRAAEWTIVERRGHAAMYAGVQALANDNLSTIHIGWTGPIHVNNSHNTVLPDQLSKEDKSKLEDLLWEKKIVPLFLNEAASRGHYEGYCKEVLWPLFHYVVWDKATDGRSEKKFWSNYKAVNQQFADAVIERYQPGDFIFINDYHLLLVPSMIREKLPDAIISIFIHATFPSSEIFRCLPSRNKILQGMLGANLVGFQTFSYARHFISSCTRVLGCESTHVGVNYNGQMVSVSDFPIGVDIERVNMFREQPGVKLKMAAIREMHAGKKIVIGRDKLDITKGVVQKLRAFECFLKNYPKWRNEVVLIQVATPTYGDHAKLDTKISEMVSHINGTYGSLEFTPVHYYHQDVDRDEYYALLSVADVGMITCTRDGMNTTSFEFTICQRDTHSPLILSEFAGTAGTLSAALLVNPWDYSSVAKALNNALLMPSEDKLTRYKQHSHHVEKHSAAFWSRSIIKELARLSEQHLLQSHVTPTLNVDKLVTDYKSTKKRLMFFDYDGTLTPIVSVPSDAKPAEDMLSYLQTLCNDPQNVVWVVSGRDQDTLNGWLGARVTNLGLSAEHGCYLKYPNKPWESVLDNVDMSWKQDVTEIFDYYTERTQGSFVEHKKSSITWHYRMADAVFGEFQAKECQNHMDNAIGSKYPVEVLVGKKNLEVRPMSINKGEIVKKILLQHPDCDLVICAGDDKTDEDMFRALSTAVRHTSSSSPITPVPVSSQRAEQEQTLFSITVGPPEKKTMANWHVGTSFDIVACLKSMANC